MILNPDRVRSNHEAKAFVTGGTKGLCQRKSSPAVAEKGYQVPGISPTRQPIR
jgi:hypothetical protein